MLIRVYRSSSSETLGTWDAEYLGSAKLEWSIMLHLCLPPFVHLQSRKDIFDEPICEQAILQPIQGYDR
jgi:hypothetical protein